MQRKSLAWRLYLGVMTVLTIKTFSGLFHPRYAIDFLNVAAGIVAWLGLLAYVNGLAAGPRLFWRIFAAGYACDLAFGIGKVGGASRVATHHPNPAVGYAAGILAIAFVILLSGPTILACLRLGGLFLREVEKPDDYRVIFA